MIKLQSNANRLFNYYSKIFGGTDKKKMGLLLQIALMVGFISVFICAGILLNCKNIMVLFVDSKEIAM
jgi:hypothetical protein